MPINEQRIKNLEAKIGLNSRAKEYAAYLAGVAEFRAMMIARLDALARGEELPATEQGHSSEAEELRVELLNRLERVARAQQQEAESAR